MSLLLNEKEQLELIDIFKDLIKIQSVQPLGDESKVSDYIENLLNKEGIKTTTLYKEENRKNLVATIKGKEKPPIILLSHVDVVKANGNWKYDPFLAYEEDGIIYGRGALDTKQLTAMQIISMLKLKRMEKEFNRDIVLIASADEEAGSNYGMKYLRENYPDIIPNGGFTISEGGGFVIESNGRKFRTCTCGEKGDSPVDINIKNTNKSNVFDVRNHSSYKCLDVINQLSKYKSEEKLCRVTERFRDITTDSDLKNKTLKDLWEYSTKHDLQIVSFSKEYDINNIHEDVQIKTSFKFIPGTSKDQIKEIYNSLLKNKDTVINIINFEEGYESILDSDFVENLIHKADLYDPNSIFLPMIALGRTDGRFIRENVYGFSPLLGDLPFSEVLKKVHGVDECITIDSLVYGANVIFSAIEEICFN